ncbi:hypothetical protein [Nocardioides sp. GXQ0305]|uniref:hypothetical protein n=1 Tax=Nocardioides sp. GXQ0305 TaxID=3423912 RepID=UPI003D7E33EA
MTLRTKTIATGAALAALAALLAATTAPAQARWRFHDPSVGEAMFAPPGGTRADTCADRVRGRTGYSGVFESSQEPLPPEATTSVTYEVWKAPEGFLNFQRAVTEDSGQVVFHALDGSIHPATRVGTATTALRSDLDPAEPWGLDPGELDQLFVIASAPISIPLTDVQAGDRLGLAPEPNLRAHFVNLRVINCDLPVLEPRVDLLPASPTNVVRPHNTTDRVSVRIFGSRRLLVRHINEVHLGEAEPVEVRAPRDVDGDGRADRTYVFTQGSTDIQCYDNGVKVTGRTTDRVRFQVRSQITVVGCAGLTSADQGPLVAQG